MACVVVCSFRQSFGWSSGLGRRFWMSFGVRSFCSVRWWVDESWVVLLWLVFGVVGGGNWTSHLLVGVGLSLCMCGDGCAGGYRVLVCW